MGRCQDLNSHDDKGRKGFEGKGEEGLIDAHHGHFFLPGLGAGGIVVCIPVASQTPSAPASHEGMSINRPDISGPGLPFCSETTKKRKCCSALEKLIC